MQAEVKKIAYTPESVNERTGEVKPAKYALSIEVELTPESVEAIQEVMLRRSGTFEMTLDSDQELIPGVTRA